MSANGARCDVAVIGGGWAGMAAAVTLAAADVPVIVFEAALTLGGRARRLAADAATLDNGQHLLLGAYRETLALIHRVQPDRPAEALYARTPLALLGPGAFQLRAARLPAPLHMLAALLCARGCTISDRLAVVRAFAGWRWGGWQAPATMTVAELLQAQPPAMTALLWTPLCLAALNTPPAAASAQVFLNVVRDALAADSTASDLIIPVTDLSALFPDRAADFIEARGGVVRRGALVRGLAVQDDAVRVEVAGAIQGFRHVVVATAPAQAAGLLRGLPHAAGVCAAIDAYRYEPITTIYLRYDTPYRLPARMLQLDRGPGQWVFDRSAPDTAGPLLLAVIISTDGPHRRLAKAELVLAVTGQLRANLSERHSQLVPGWTRIITERRATHACTPQRGHPLAGPIGAGIYLAGDHTDPDYPATLEAAVRSGVRAAASVLDRR